MIEKKEAAIRCDFCARRVAIKKAFRFHSVYTYYTIGKKHFDYGQLGGERVHLCHDCYKDMRNAVVDVFGKRRRQDETF